MLTGMTERLKNEILEQHERDVEKLNEEHEEQRLKQEKLLKVLSASLRKWFKGALKLQFLLRTILYRWFPHDVTPFCEAVSCF